MAKGQVSEEELTKGLKGIGNFAGLSPSRVRRDNPFRDSRADNASPEPVKTIEVMERAPEKRASKSAASAVSKMEPKGVRPVARMPKTIEKEGRGEKTAEVPGARKSDIYTEPVTLKITPEMRDDVGRIARELQRAKISKKERITGNTVMRVAIRLITKRFQLKPGEAPNDEEELFDLVERALTRNGS